MDNFESANQLSHLNTKMKWWIFFELPSFPVFLSPQNEGAVGGVNHPARRQ